MGFGKKVAPHATGNQNFRSRNISPVRCNPDNPAMANNEVQNFHAESFGEDRLLEQVGRCYGSASALQVREEVLGAVSRFKGEVAQQDDLTLIVLKLR